MNILALDCATKTGWSLLCDGRIESGVQDFTKRRGESNGMMFFRFTGWLKNEFSQHNIKLVVYELAHYRGGGATEICVNLTGRAQEFAASIGAECMGIHSNTLKKFATGHGKADKKAIMDWYFMETGQKAIDDNMADSYALLRFAMNEIGESLE